MPPFVAGAHKALAIRDYCVREGLALEQSFAYSDTFSDYPMLAVVGHPAAVNPDARLRAWRARTTGPSSDARSRDRMRDPKSLARFYETTNHIVTIDTDSPPRIMFSGEDLLLEDLPVGTRVIYPKPPMTGSPNPKRRDPLRAQPPRGLRAAARAARSPGMKVTIAVDDISLPLPPMRTPDVRQLVLEIVCEMLADSRRRRRPHHHRHRAPPPHDTTAEMQAHGGRQGLRRLLARTALQPRRLRPRRHGRARQDARTASWSR